MTDIRPPASPGHRGRVVLSDTSAAVLAGSVCLGAFAAWPVPAVAIVVAAGLGLVVRRPWCLLIVGALLASHLGHRAATGLDVSFGPVESDDVRVVSDPSWRHGAVRSVLAVEGRHLDAWARGEDAAFLEDRLMGERLALRGQIVPLPASARWLRDRHVAARLEVDSITAAGPPGAVVRSANAYRRLLVAGAASLPEENRSLFTGLVFGDDRAQSDELKRAFRSSGLSHLLAVSGQNVAFVLVVIGPLLRHLDRRNRLVLLLAALVVFALVTRCEPSVLRATAMAGLAAVSTTLGRPTPALRILSLAVAGVVLVDPFLVRSIGFQLSVAASAGILFLSSPIARRLPLPPAAAEPIGVTIAAQLAVAPIQLAAFGPVPLASIPANVAAGPIAGAAMVYGLVGGTLAGLIGGGPAAWIHRPTSIMTAAIAGIARLGERHPIGSVGWIDLVVLTTIGLAARSIDQRAGQQVLVTSGVAYLMLITTLR